MQLKEKLDEFELQGKAKKEELILIGEQYLELEDEKKELLVLIEQVKEQAKASYKSG